VTDRRNLEAYYPFTRLNRLLDGLAPGRSPLEGGAPVLLSIGEPQHQPPDFVAEEIQKNAAGWSRYPPARGTEAYRTAAADWLLRRYGLPQDAAAPGAMPRRCSASRSQAVEMSVASDKRRARAPRSLIRGDPSPGIPAFRGICLHVPTPPEDQAPTGRRLLACR